MNFRQCSAAWLLAAMVSLIGNVQAADRQPGGFQSRTFVDADGASHRYVIFVPYKLEAESRPPALLFLHGSGERGDNGLDQIMVGLGPALWKQKATFPFVTVFPQCRRESNWQVDGPDAQRALAMFRQVQQEFNTDPDRVYLTGLSMGGGGCWSIAEKHPDMFAAIVPMCSRAELSLASKLAEAKLPIWNFCGDQDRQPTVQFSRDMQAALLKAGAESKYTEYPGVGHNCWDNAYNTPELYTWLLEHKRRAAQR
jgi:predicted peptidase